MAAHDEDLRTARVLFDLLVDETSKAEAVLTQIASRIKDDEALAHAIAAQARALKHAAQEAAQLVALLSSRA